MPMLGDGVYIHFGQLSPNLEEEVDKYISSRDQGGLRLGLGFLTTSQIVR